MSGDGMGTGLEYAWLAVVLSTLGVALAVAYTIRVVHSYRVFHDERAAVALVKGLGLLMIAGGFWVSASGLLINSSAMSVAGMSVSRGTFIVMMATLLLAGARPSHTGQGPTE